ncbi:MAG: flavodoxin domain-containing protein [Spirochaetaceae bacterium]|nr:flavodoxin domain-containing protein [Spirochaetaceae bacterium]
MKKAVVLFASKTGSTAEAAREIAKTLESKGVAAEALSIAGGADLASYDVFVIGAPINGMRWREDALAFVRANAEALRRKPVYYFCLSIAYGIGRPSFKRSIPRLLDATAALVKPEGVAAFGGRMDADPPWILRLAFGIPKGASWDSLDMGAVRTWAEVIAERLGTGKG